MRHPITYRSPALTLDLATHCELTPQTTSQLCDLATQLGHTQTTSTIRSTITDLANLGALRNTPDGWQLTPLGAAWLTNSLQHLPTITRHSDTWRWHTPPDTADELDALEVDD